MSRNGVKFIRIQWWMFFKWRYNTYIQVTWLLYSTKYKDLHISAAHKSAKCPYATMHDGVTIPLNLRFVDPVYSPPIVLESYWNDPNQSHDVPCCSMQYTIALTMCTNALHKGPVIHYQRLQPCSASSLSRTRLLIIFEQLAEVGEVRNVFTTLNVNVINCWDTMYLQK